MSDKNTLRYIAETDVTIQDIYAHLKYLTEDKRKTFESRRFILLLQIYILC